MLKPLEWWMRVCLFLSLTSVIWFWSTHLPTPLDGLGSTNYDYLIVGARDDPEFGRAVAFGWRLEDANRHVRVRAYALEDEERLRSWIRKKRSDGTLRGESGGGKVFAFDALRFLGGFQALVENAKGRGLVVRGKGEEARGGMRGDDGQDRGEDGGAMRDGYPGKDGVAMQRVSRTEDETVKSSRGEDGNTMRGDEQSRGEDGQENGDLEELDGERIQPKTTTRKYQPTVTFTPLPVEDANADPRDYLPVQVSFKNKIVTGYRAAEGKKFTNYYPLAEALIKISGWQFAPRSPLLASVILVQDQTSASLSMIKYPRALLNNIGWGGQSCMGGTKGFQIQCRTKRVEEDGCKYESLKIQPKQYRMWVSEECLEFFQELSCADASRFWIQKPSGGQHGAGMQVHQGCSRIREDFEVTCLQWPALKKKYFIMPYLEPVLLSGHKFDVRSYILLASIEPLLVFYGDGFVRRATSRYSTDNLNDKAAHITNSVEQNAKDDHFWDFDRLSDYLSSNANFPAKFMSNRFREQAFRVSNFVVQCSRPYMKRKPGRFQLFAVDWIVDSSGGIHMLEVNSNPLVGQPYPGLGKHFPRIWNELMTLVVNIQTGATKSSVLKTNRYRHGNWHLIFNEIEEARPYNSCVAFDPMTWTMLPEVMDTHHDAMHPEPEKVLADFPAEIKDEEAIELEENAEKIEAAGEGEVDAKPAEQPLSEVDKVNENANQRISLGKRNNKERLPIECPFSKHFGDGRKRCVLGGGTEDETSFFIVESAIPGPVVLVVAGVHGNEGAGVVAARYVARNWKPQTGTLVVLERANARGVANNMRFVPACASHPFAYDLNRAFNMQDELERPLAKMVWDLMEDVNPELMFDLHEGRSFFAESDIAQGIPDNKTLDNVGSTNVIAGKVSKGNSIVTSKNALELAHLVRKEANKMETDPGRRFLVMVPPILGGLAYRLMRRLEARVMLFETTLVFPLDVRARQHLYLLSVALRAVGMMNEIVKIDDSSISLDSCVASRKLCNLEV